MSNLGGSSGDAFEREPFARKMSEMQRSAIGRVCDHGRKMATEDAALACALASARLIANLVQYNIERELKERITSV